MITQEQISKALYKFKKNFNLESDFTQIPIKICYFHHPLECLDQNEIRNCRNRIGRNFDFLLTGHIHDSAHDKLEIDGNYQVIKIVAGSTFIRNSERGKQCYNLIKIDNETLEGYGYFRMFEERTGYWSIDTSVSGGAGFVKVDLSYNL